MIEDILGLLGDQPKRRFVQEWAELHYGELALRKILVKGQKDGFLVQQNNTLTNPAFCAPWTPALADTIEALLGRIRLIREEASRAEAAVRREIFETLRKGREHAGSIKNA